MSAGRNAQRLSTALREMQSQAELRFHDKGELQPAAIHKEYLSVRRQGAGHVRRCDAKQTLVTASRVLTMDHGRHFKHKLDALLEEAAT